MITKEDRIHDLKEHNYYVFAGGFIKLRMGKGKNKGKQFYDVYCYSNGGHIESIVKSGLYVDQDPEELLKDVPQYRIRHRENPLVFYEQPIRRRVN